MNTIGSKIKTLRENNNITKSEFARMIDVSPAYITMLENGKKANPSYSLLRKISSVLGISISEILEGNKNITCQLVDLLRDSIPKDIDSNLISDCIENNKELPENYLIHLSDTLFEKDPLVFSKFLYDNINLIQRPSKLYRSLQTKKAILKELKIYPSSSDGNAIKKYFDMIKHPSRNILKNSFSVDTDSLTDVQIDEIMSSIRFTIKLKLEEFKKDIE